MMTTEQRIRFDFLRAGPFVPAEYVRDYYGLPWPLGPDAELAFEKFRNQLPRWVRYPDGQVSRYDLERFMSRQHVLPQKWMAIRLGMQSSSLGQLLDRLPDLGLSPGRYVVFDEFVADSL